MGCANVDGRDFFIPVGISGADGCTYSFSQAKKNFHVELTGRDSKEGFVSVNVPKALFSGSFSVFIDGKQQDSAYIVGIGGADGSLGSTSIQQRFNWSNPEAQDTVSIDVYATKVLPEFGAFPYHYMLAASVGVVVFVTRSYVCQRR